MENIIIGLIGITIGFCTGHILGSRREAEKHRACHRRMRQTIEGLTGIMVWIDLAKKDTDRAVAFEAKIEKGKLVSVKPVQLPKDFGKMKDEVKPAETVVPVPVKRKRKPRTAAQKKVAREKMREYRARKRNAQK